LRHPQHFTGTSKNIEQTMRAMILAAGMGTRLKPFTDKHPKALAVVNGKTVLQRNVEYLQQFGITDVIVNVHHFSEQIVETIAEANGWGSQISISDERDGLLETGGGILKASDFLKQSDTCLVMNVDMLTDLDLRDLVDAHRQTNCMATLATTKRATSRYLLFNQQGLLNGWKNEATGEFRPANLTQHGSANSLQPYAFSGIQVLSSSIFKFIRFSGKFSMIDVYLDLCSRFRITNFDHSEGQLIDIGTPEKLAAAESLFV
jgi:N-acetyl-alpha-D-muramate 1-phosphate uridylyltransferase